MHRTCVDFSMTVPPLEMLCVGGMGRVSETGLGKPTLWFRVGVSAWSTSCAPGQKAPQSSTLERMEHPSQGFLHGAQGSLLLTLHPTSPPMVSLAGRSVPRQDKLLAPMVSTPCPPPHPFKFNWPAQRSLHMSPDTPSSLLVSLTTFLWVKTANLKFRSCLKYERDLEALHLPSLVPDTIAMVWGYRLVPAPSKFKLIFIFDLWLFSCRFQGRWVDKNDFIIFSQKSVFFKILL